MGVCHSLVASGWVARCINVNAWLGTSDLKFTLGTGGVNLREIAPDREPLAVLTVNELTTDFKFELVEEGMAEIASGNNGTGGGKEILGLVLNPEALEKIAVTGDGDRYTRARVR
jgi:hypothetical protein